MCGPLRGCTRDGGVDAGGAPGALRAELAGVPGAWRLTLLSRHTPGRRRRAEGSRPRPTPGKPLAEGAGRRSPRLREAARANRPGRAGPSGIPPTLTASIRGRSSRFRASPPRPSAPRNAESESRGAQRRHIQQRRTHSGVCPYASQSPPPPPRPVTSGGTRSFPVLTLLPLTPGSPSGRAARSRPSRPRRSVPVSL